MKASLEQNINKLPEPLKKEVEDFVLFLVQKRMPKNKNHKLSLTWAGGLKDLKDKFTSVELQHHALGLWQK